MNKAKICATCGTHYPMNFTENHCLICEDDRQYIPLNGQQWINSHELHRKHSIKITELKPYLFEFIIQPAFAIGQRALFVVSTSGNILWDCIPMLNENVIRFVKEKGGLKAIAISHPHYYSNMEEWGNTFCCPIYLPESEKGFVVKPAKRIEYWATETLELCDGVKLMRIGGHFPGSSILYLPNISPQGTILCGDTFNLSLSMKHFSVMYSYPNKIPLPIKEIELIKNKMDKLVFDEIYGFWPYQNLTLNAKITLIESLARYK